MLIRKITSCFSVVNKIYQYTKAATDSMNSNFVN